MNGGIDSENHEVRPVRVKQQVHMEMVLKRDRMIRGLKSVVVAFGIIMIIELGLIILLIWKG